MSCIGNTEEGIVCFNMQTRPIQMQRVKEMIPVIFTLDMFILTI